MSARGRFIDGFIDPGKQRDGGGTLDPWGSATPIDPDGFDGGSGADLWPVDGGAVVDPWS
jgi:hypothetical protein